MKITDKLCLIEVSTSHPLWEECLYLDLKEADEKELKQSGYKTLPDFLTDDLVYKTGKIHLITYEDKPVAVMALHKFTDGTYLTFFTVELDRALKYHLFKYYIKFLEILMIRAKVTECTAYVPEWYQEAIKMVKRMGFKYDSSMVVRGTIFIPYTYRMISDTVTLSRR